MASQTEISGRKGWLLTLLCVCTLSLLAGCGTTPASVHLPAKPHNEKTADATVAHHLLLSPQQRVIAAYTGYTTAMATAFDSRSAAQVRRLLRPYLDAATIANAVHAFSQAWAKNEVSYGHVEWHIIGVRVKGTAAWVHDCDNSSRSGLQYASTGQIVQGSLGIADENIVTRLNLVRGHWVVLVQTVEDVSCTA